MAAAAKRPAYRSKKPEFEPGSWEESVSKLIRAYKICVKDAGLKDSQFGDILKLLNRTLSPPEDEYDAKTEAPPVPKKLILTSPVVGFDPMAFRALTVAMTAVKYSVCTAICIWNADIGDAGAIDLSKALPVMPQCTKLEIFHSLVGPTGVEAIANACLRKRKTSYLQILRLDHNPIGTAGVSALCDALVMNDQLKTLSLAYCQIDAGGGDAMSKLLGSPDTRLRTLNLSGNPLYNPGIIALAEGLVKNRGSLTSLNIAHTEFGHGGTNDLSGVKMLAAALKLSDHLTACNASGNLIGNDGCQLLVSALAGATHIRELEVTAIGIDKPIYEMLLTFLTANQPEPKKKKLKKKPKQELKFGGGGKSSGKGSGRTGTVFATSAGSGSARLSATLAAAAKTNALPSPSAAAASAALAKQSAANNNGSAASAKDSKSGPAPAGGSGQAVGSGTPNSSAPSPATPVAPSPNAVAAGTGGGGGGGSTNPSPSPKQ